MVSTLVSWLPWISRGCGVPRPDYVIEIREDVLREIDGPMLIHGLQGWNGQSLRVPFRREFKPDPARLAERYELFRAEAR